MNREAGYLVEEVVEVMRRYWWSVVIDLLQRSVKELEPQSLIELEEMV